MDTLEINKYKVIGSFRDPKGHVYQVENKIYRSITSKGIGDFESVKSTGILDDLVKDELLVPWEEVTDIDLGPETIKAIKILEHPKIDFISYPYEWTSSGLKSAALLHLNIQIRALKHNVVLSDASAYNIQFNGTNPVFIDHLSFRPYHEGEYWLGHRQFCEQFLAPLLLQSISGITYHSWYRGSIEGISLTDTAKLLPWKVLFSPQILSNIILPVYFEKNNRRGNNKNVSEKISQKKLPKNAYMGMLVSLRKFISNLESFKNVKTIWEDYDKNNIYTSNEASLKRDFIREFSDQVKPRILGDIGCNTGEYSEVAINAGANKIIGFEYDLGALELSFKRAVKNNLDFLPLYLDVANPTPSQGWMQSERQGIVERKNADSILSLALIHHLCIGRNIPMNDVIQWLVDLSPTGIIEFVPKSDPMVQELLQLREDIFDDYSKDTFKSTLSKVARIEKSKIVTKSGRELFWYVRL